MKQKIPGHRMNAACRASRRVWTSLVAAASFAISITTATAEEVQVSLRGDQEVPPVTTPAKASGVIAVAEDKSVSGRVTTSGVEGVAAHIHLAAPGKNGPPVITLTKTSENVWSIPAGAKLTDEQYASFKAGHLYVNVHSAAHKSGEIRGQLQP